MPGLLGDIFSAGDRAKRQLRGLLSDPMGSIEQTAGRLQDYRREDQDLYQRAFSNPAGPLQVTDQQAMGRLGDRAASGLLAMSLGMNLNQQTAEIMNALAGLPKGAKVGLRVLPDDIPTPSIGEALRPSTKWKDGIKTDKQLFGTSTMGIGKMTEPEVAAALQRLKLFGGWGYYPGNKLAVVSGTASRKGEDAGEQMLRDAYVHYLTDLPMGPR